MTHIELQTIISAPLHRCFDLSLSVDIHKLSTRQTNEKIVSGVAKGLMKSSDVVTWRARHFGIYQNLTSKITEFDRPHYFVSEMIRGAFKRMRHQHLFERSGNETLMTDLFAFEAPFGWLGNFVSHAVLKNHMRKLLIMRNQTIKSIAEGDEWKKFLYP